MRIRQIRPHPLQWNPVRPSARLLALCTTLVIAAVPACSGGSSGNSPRSPVPTPAPTTQNPCLTAAIDAPGEGEGPALNETEAAAVKRRGRGLDGDPRGRVFDSLWRHAASAATRTLFTPPARAATEDVGEVAVIQDAGDLITPPNTFDLAGTRSALHPQRRELRREPHRRHVPLQPRHPHHAWKTTTAWRSRCRSRSRSTARRSRGVRQLRRQHHLRGGGQREHRAQRVARC